MEISVYNGGYIEPEEYNAHIDLLEKNKGSSVLIGILRKLGYSDYTTEKLKNALLELTPKATVIQVVLPETQFKTISESKYKKIDFSSLPDDLKHKNIELGAMYQEMSFEAATLEYVSDEERLIKALKITDLAAERRAIYIQIEKSQEKDIPDTEPKKYVFPEHKSDSLLLLQRKRVQRSKLKNKPARQDEHKEICSFIIELEKHLGINEKG